MPKNEQYFHQMENLEMSSKEQSRAGCSNFSPGHLSSDKGPTFECNTSHELRDRNRSAKRAKDETTNMNYRRIDLLFCLFFFIIFVLLFVLLFNYFELYNNFKAKTNSSNEVFPNRMRGQNAEKISFGKWRFLPTKPLAKPIKIPHFNFNIHQ